MCGLSGLSLSLIYFACMFVSLFATSKLVLFFFFTRQSLISLIYEHRSFYFQLSNYLILSFTSKPILQNTIIHKITRRNKRPHPQKQTHINIMWILPIIGYIGIAFGFIFLTLAIGIHPPPHSLIPLPLHNKNLTHSSYLQSSIRPILPLRTSRRTHRHLQKDPLTFNTHNNDSTNPTMAIRWIPPNAFRVHDFQSFRV